MAACRAPCWLVPHLRSSDITLFFRSYLIWLWLVLTAPYLKSAGTHVTGCSIFEQLLGIVCSQ